MTFNNVLKETLFVKTAGHKKTVHDPKRTKYASDKTDDVKDYEATVKAVKSGKKKSYLSKGAKAYKVKM